VEKTNGGKSDPTASLGEEKNGNRKSRENASEGKGGAPTTDRRDLKPPTSLGGGGGGFRGWWGGGCGGQRKATKKI